jgi:site-specific recombinase XerD
METLPACDYQSFLADWIRDYLDYLDHLGSSTLRPARDLRRIDRFLVEDHIHDLRQCDNRLLIRLAGRYRDQLSPGTLRLWACTFRGFCRFLVRQGCMTENPLASPPVSKPHSYRPYVFSPVELHRFFDYLHQQSARFVNPLAAYRFRSLYTFYHLLYACGLRVSEAIRLTVADYSPAQSTLFIQPSKFHKDRLIPAGRKVCANLERLLSLRQHLFGMPADGRFFLLLPQRRPYHQRTVSGYFQTVLQRLRIYRPRITYQGCTHGTPHLHELRRAFAVHRLLKWYHQQANVDAKLPLLATYMGHSNFEHTKTYLTLTQQLLAEAGRRFARRFDRLDWLTDDPKL